MTALYTKGRSKKCTYITISQHQKDTGDFHIRYLQKCRDVGLNETLPYETEAFEVRNRDETETSEAQGRDETETIKTSRDVRDRDVFYR